MNGETSADAASKQYKRTQFLVLPGFQLRFMLYIIGFALFGIVVLYASNHIYFNRLIAEGQQLGLAPDHIYFEFVNQQRELLNTTFMMVAAVVFGALIVMGLVLSHKIAGPIYRIQLHLQEIRETGEASRPLAFRDSDFFPEVADLVDELVERARKARESGD